MAFKSLLANTQTISVSIGQYIFLPQRRIRLVLALKNHRARLQHRNGMPHTLGNVHPIHPLQWVQLQFLHHVFIIVERLHQQPPPQQHIRFLRMPVPMNRQHGAQLQRVQKPLRQRLRPLVEIEVHPLAGVLGGLGGEGV